VWLRGPAGLVCGRRGKTGLWGGGVAGGGGDRVSHGLQWPYIVLRMAGYSLMKHLHRAQSGAFLAVRDVLQLGALSSCSLTGRKGA